MYRNYSAFESLQAMQSLKWDTAILLKSHCSTILYIPIGSNSNKGHAWKAVCHGEEKLQSQAYSAFSDRNCCRFWVTMTLCLWAWVFVCNGASACAQVFVCECDTGITISNLMAVFVVVPNLHFFPHFQNVDSTVLPLPPPLSSLSPLWFKSR